MPDALVKRSFVASAAIIVSVALASFMTPRSVTASGASAIDVGRMIPEAFGQWHLVPGITLVDQEPDSLANRIYSQSIGRAYRDGDGHVVMLLVAYGPNQSEGLQLHRPEICYVADGYAITDVDRTSISYHARIAPLPVTRVLANREDHSEPISYWMRVGDDVTQSALGQNLVRLRYGLRGRVPDGVLVRVSTIGKALEGYAVEDRFVSDLLDALPTGSRAFLIGSSA